MKWVQYFSLEDCSRGSIVNQSEVGTNAAPVLEPRRGSEEDSRALVDKEFSDFEFGVGDKGKC